jgi:hypothetical protein
MDTILENTLGENFFDTCALADFALCATTGVNINNRDFGNFCRWRLQEAPPTKKSCT